jgi:hypothetical protein
MPRPADANVIVNLQGRFRLLRRDPVVGWSADIDPG